MLKDNYKNIIFDLGGVIITLDYQLTINEFSKLCNRSFDEFFTQYQQLTFFDEFERGEITAEQFRDSIRKEFNLNVSNESIDFAWNAMLGSIPQERLDFLKELGKEKRIFLLSNTNEIHLKAFTEIILKENAVKDLAVFFEKAYYSHLVKMRKPESRIFDYVINENNLIPSETLFIDDSIQHIEGAKKVGLNAELLPKDYSIIDFLCG